jgi:hypothetical protein
MLEIVNATAQTTRRLATSLALGLLVGVAACGGDGSDDAAREVTPGGASDAGTSPEGSAAKPPLYLVSAEVSAGDQYETYMALAPSFDATTQFNPLSGIKLLGRMSPIAHNGAVYTPDANAPVITRYDLNASDQLVKGAELSFLGVGVTEIAGWNVYFVSDDKAYVFDPASSRLIVWNPQTMTLTGKQIDLSSLRRDKFLPGLALEQTGPVRRGSQLFIPVSWADQDWSYRYASGLLVLDTDADAVVTTAEDTRCGEAFMTIAAPNGDLYYFPSADSSAQHFYADNHRPTCVLRVRSGEQAFDPTYQLDLSALGGGTAAIGAVPDGKSGFFFATADQTRWEAREENEWSFWRYHHYDFATQAHEPVPSLPFWAGSTYWVKVDGKTYLPHWEKTASTSKTTVYGVDGAAAPTPVFSFPASWRSIYRLR